MTRSHALDPAICERALRCTDLGGKHPAEFAIAVAADILRARERRQATAPARRAA